ncbi:MAG: hypothetical protein QFB87_04280 [Patescibacteria group bacterium]|nr:hypothetical protein [Patescibacteria group bacterium]
MQRRVSINPIAKGTVVIAALLGLLSGVTYAALQGQSKFTGSTIQTATANLVVSRDGTTFSNSQSGMTFNNVIPGGSLSPSAGYPVYMKNAGGTPLSLKLAVSSTPTNPDTVDLTKVNVVLTSTASGQSQTFSLQSLIDSHTTGGSAITILPVLFPEQTHPFILQVSMAKDAFSGTSASIGAIDFSLTGVAVN